MTNSGKRWAVQDRYGNFIYLTEERWEHIIDDFNHPEMMDYEEHLKTTIKKGRRRQEPLNPYKYRYYHPFDDLPDGANHVIAIVLFRFQIVTANSTMPRRGTLRASHNFVATAFFQHIRRKR